MKISVCSSLASAYSSSLFWALLGMASLAAPAWAQPTEPPLSLPKLGSVAPITGAAPITGVAPIERAALLPVPLLIGIAGDALGWKPGPDRAVTALARDRAGCLWVATEDAGVWRYDANGAETQSKWQQFAAKDGISDENVYTLAVDKQGRVWAGTLNHGVSVWNGKVWKNYGVLDGPLGERVFDIAICPTDGDVWLATNAGLTRYSVEKDSWNTVTRADGLLSDQVQAIAFDEGGNIVLGTQCDGVVLAQAADGYKTWRVVKGPEQMPVTSTGKGLPSNLVNDVLVAHDGTIYVATTTGLAWSSDQGINWSYVRGKDYAAKVQGLMGSAPEGWKERPGAVLAEDYVSCLAQDEAGRLWLGHWRAGNEVLEKQSGPEGAVMKAVKQESSGFVKAILPVSNASPLVARYDEGIGDSLIATAKTEIYR